MENFDIRLIRLKNGEDLICFCYRDYKNKKVIIKYPKVFYQDFDEETLTSQIILSDWLPKYAYAISEVAVDLDEVLFYSYSSVEFGCQYLDSLLNELEDSESDLTKSIRKTLNEYSDKNSESVIPKGTIIH